MVRQCLCQQGTQGLGFAGVQTADFFGAGFHIPVPQVGAQGNLLRLGRGLGKGVFHLMVGGGQRRAEHHKADANARQQQGGEGAHIHHIAAAQGVQRGGGGAAVQKVVFKVVLDHHSPGICRVGAQLQPPLNGHHISLPVHVGGRYIDNVCVLVPGAHGVAVGGKHGAALYKAAVREGHGAPPFQQYAEDLQQHLHPGAYHNMFRRSDHIAPLPHIVCQGAPQVVLSLGLAVSEQPLPLAQGTLNVALP